MRFTVTPLIHPSFSPVMQKSVLPVCVSVAALQIVSLVPFFFKLPYVCVICDICFSLWRQKILSSVSALLGLRSCG